MQCLNLIFATPNGITLSIHCQFTIEVSLFKLGLKQAIFTFSSYEKVLVLCEKSLSDFFFNANIVFKIIRIAKVIQGINYFDSNYSNDVLINYVTQINCP